MTRRRTPLTARHISTGTGGRVLGKLLLHPGPCRLSGSAAEPARRRSPLVRFMNATCLVVALALGSACQKANDGEGCNEATNKECAP